VQHASIVLMLFEKLNTAHGTEIAYDRSLGKGPGVIYLGGFRSNMDGTKALYLQNLCESLDLSFVRFDYRGHGASSGRFEDGSLSIWLADSLAVLDQLTEGPQIVVGSSMGAWLMIELALLRLTRLKALVGIAAAPDFTDDFSRLNAQQKQELDSQGFFNWPSSDGSPYTITRAFIDDSHQHRILDKPLPILCPVRLLHGTADESVPWQQSLKLAEQLQSADVELTLLKDANHRLSSDKALARLAEVMISLVQIDCQ
jgi:pimeloyl-ACP methyl ester carboxylesterase